MEPITTLVGLNIFLLDKNHGAWNYQEYNIRLKTFLNVQILKSKEQNEDYFVKN